MDRLKEGDVMLVGVIAHREGGFSVVGVDGLITPCATEAAAMAANKQEAEHAERETLGAWGLVEEVHHVA